MFLLAVAEGILGIKYKETFFASSYLSQIERLQTMAQRRHTMMTIRSRKRNGIIVYI